MGIKPVTRGFSQGNEKQKLCHKPDALTRGSRALSKGKQRLVRTMMKRAGSALQCGGASSDLGARLPRRRTLGVS
jgi:hypothetical protein